MNGIRSSAGMHDKHLSYSWENAKWMYDTARELGIPLGAGSSLPTVPLSWRRPQRELPLGTWIERALVLASGPLEAYGFHALETLQHVVERRAGGETGVATVQCLRGDAVWQAADAGVWDLDLLEATLRVTERQTADDPRQAAVNPAIFLLRYRDGLRATVCMFNGVTRQRSFAAEVRLPDSHESEVFAAGFHGHGQEPYGHFAWLNEEIQDLICTWQEPHPVERTLLTTGMLDRVMESHWRGGVALETPELDVRYRVAK